MVWQKLSDVATVLGQETKTSYLEGALSRVLQFLIETPDFMVKQENDAYLTFKGMIRSDIFFFLETVLGK